MERCRSSTGNLRQPSNRTKMCMTMTALVEREHKSSERPRSAKLRSPLVLAPLGACSWLGKNAPTHHACANRKRDFIAARYAKKLRSGGGQTHASASISSAR
jgi:hypothetical protein